MAPETFDDLLAMLHRRAKRLVRCPEAAADVAQDTALRVWRQMEDGLDIDNTEAYAMAALKNRARSYWRAQREVSELTEDVGAVEPDAMRRIACAELFAAMARLPEAQARLMTMVAEGETSPSNLARLTGLPTGTVMSRLARARASLRLDMGLSRTAPSESLYRDAQG